MGCVFSPQHGGGGIPVRLLYDYYVNYYVVVANRALHVPQLQNQCAPCLAWLTQAQLDPKLRSWMGGSALKRPLSRAALGRVRKLEHLAKCGQIGAGMFQSGQMLRCTRFHPSKIAVLGAIELV